MADEPNVVATPPPVAPIVQAIPAPTAPPLEPSPPPASNAAVPAGDKAPDISRDMLLTDVNPETGQAEYFTVGELIDGRRNGSESPAVTADRLSELETYAKAFEDNDQQAIQTILGQMTEKLAPAAAPPAPGSPEAEIQALKEQNQGLHSKVEQHDAIYTQISKAQDLGYIRNSIDSHKEHLPFLSNFDKGQASGIVLQNFNTMKGGRTIASIPVSERQTMFMRALASAEQAIAQVATAFGGTSPVPAANQGVPPTQLADDQNRNVPVAGQAPPQYTFVNGAMVDTQGRPVQQTAWGTIAPVNAVPNTIPDNINSSGAPTINPQQVVNQGKFSLEQLKENMRARRAQ